MSHHRTVVEGGSVAVVGGGVAGLVAAHRLSAGGATVTVIEADDRLGGKLRTSAFAGRSVDEGADAFLLRVPWAIDLCRELGIEGELVNPTVRNAYVYNRGDLRPLPPQLMGVPIDLDAVADGGHLSTDGLVRLRSDLTLGPTPPADGDESIAAAIERRLGREALDRLVAPLVGGINAGDVGRLSLRAVVPQLDAAARDGAHASLIEACRAQVARAAPATDTPIFATPAAGMERLVKAITATWGAVNVRIGRRVETIEPSNRSGRQVLHVDDGTAIDVDAVILAVPPHAAAPLVRDVAPTSTDLLAGIGHASVAIVTIAVRPGDIDRALDASGFLVPQVEGIALTACSWTSTKWAHLHPDHGDGTVVLRASVGRHDADGALELDDDDLVARLLEDLALTMGLRGAPTELRVSRWPLGFPQYAPGHLERIDTVEQDLPRWLALAGAGLRGVGVPACIRSGDEAAQRVAHHLRSACA